MPSEYGPMTLGELIDALDATYRTPLPEYFANKADKERNVYIDWCDLRPGTFHSYRGYYDHLAFDFEVRGTKTVKEFLSQCRKANGDHFTGYKGGDFKMDSRTPVWVSQWGDNSHWGVVGVDDDGYTVRLKTQKFD